MRASQAFESSIVFWQGDQLTLGRPRSVHVLLTAILAVAAAVRIWGLTFGLPHTQARPDETQIIDVTLYFLRGNFNPPFFDYPWLYMWILTGLYLGYYVWGAALGSFHTVADLVASWSTNWEPFFVISRALSATAGTATVFVLYRLGRTLRDDATGLVAAVFLSVSVLHVRDSHFGTTDVTLTLLILSSVSLLVSAHLAGRRSLFALAGAVGGLAAATKYNAVFLAAPILVSQAINVIDAPGRRIQAALDGRLLWFGIPFAAAFSVGAPFIILDAERFWAAMRDLRHSMEHGTATVPLESGWLHHVKFSLRHGLGAPLLMPGLMGAVALLVREPRIGALVLAFPISYYAIAGTFRNLFFRYTIPIIPFLCLAAAWLVTMSVRRLIQPSAVPGQASRIFAAATAATAVLIALPTAISTWRFDRIINETDNRVVIAEYFRKNVPPGDSVLQSGSFYGHAQLDNRVWVPWTWDRTRLMFTVGGRPASGRPDWILVQDSPLPSMTQQVVLDFLKEDYDFAWQFTAFSPRGERVYDLQDAFFVPVAGFGGVRRPGPNFSLYKRLTASSRNGPPGAP